MILMATTTLKQIKPLQEKVTPVPKSRRSKVINGIVTIQLSDAGRDALLAALESKEPNLALQETVRKYRQQCS